MKEEMTMHIKEKELLGLLKSYFSEVEGQEVNVTCRCHKIIEGFYEEEVTKVEFIYEKCVKINNYDTTVSVTLDKDDIKEVLSKIIPNYSVQTVTYETSTYDYYGGLTFNGVNIDIKPKQSSLTL